MCHVSPEGVEHYQKKLTNYLCSTENSHKYESLINSLFVGGNQIAGVIFSCREVEVYKSIALVTLQIRITFEQFQMKITVLLIELMVYEM